MSTHFVDLNGLLNERVAGEGGASGANPACIDLTWLSRVIALFQRGHSGNSSSGHSFWSHSDFVVYLLIRNEISPSIKNPRIQAIKCKVKKSLVPSNYNADLQYMGEYHR